MANPFNLTAGQFSVEGSRKDEIYFSADAYTVIRAGANGELAVEPELRPESLYCLEIKELPPAEVYSVMKALLLATDYAREQGIGLPLDELVHFR